MGIGCGGTYVCIGCSAIEICKLAQMVVETRLKDRLQCCEMWEVEETELWLSVQECSP